MARNDHARPLSPRGIKAGLRMGHWLTEEQLLPDRVLCSTAKRARETFKLSTQLWDETPAVQIEEKLYLADVPNLLQVIRAHGKKSKRVMVIGHNPGLAELAVNLTDDGTPDTREAIGKFPTGAIAHLICNIEAWSDLGPGVATLQTFMRPRALG